MFLQINKVNYKSFDSYAENKLANKLLAVKFIYSTH